MSAAACVAAFCGAVRCTCHELWSSRLPPRCLQVGASAAEDEGLKFLMVVGKPIGEPIVQCEWPAEQDGWRREGRLGTEGCCKVPLRCCHFPHANLLLSKPAAAVSFRRPAADGPFVMTNDLEIRQAFDDYRQGRLQRAEDNPWEDDKSEL